MDYSKNLFCFGNRVYIICLCAGVSLWVCWATGCVSPFLFEAISDLWGWCSFTHATSCPVSMLFLLWPLTYFVCLFVCFLSIAAICWTFHYAKRLFETIFIHRFSHSTMPIANLFRVCTCIALVDSIYSTPSNFLSLPTILHIYTHPLHIASPELRLLLVSLII